MGTRSDVERLSTRTRKTKVSAVEQREEDDEASHPVPSVSDLGGLGVERVVPRSDDQLEPPFGSNGEVEFPESLREVGLEREVLLGDFVPAARETVTLAAEVK